MFGKSRKQSKNLTRINTALHVLDVAFTIKMTVWDRIPVAQRQRFIASAKGAAIRIGQRGVEKIPFVGKKKPTVDTIDDSKE